MLLKGKFRIATRRLRRGGTLAHVEGVRFMTYYFTPHHVLESARPRFSSTAIGRPVRFYAARRSDEFSPAFSSFVSHAREDR